MRVSFEWLQEYVKINIPVAELAERLTRSGIAVEAIEDQAAAFQGIVTAKVEKLEKHPQADHLWITRLDAGKQGIRTVITAAQNLKLHDVVPVALPGTTLLSGKVIGTAVLKGITSEGMMCSGEELGLEKESAGIWVFAENVPIGVPVAEIFGATDFVLELELTANRSDCMGIIGVAREVAAILGAEVHLPDTTVREEDPAMESLIRAEIAAPDLCPRYSGRVITDVKIEPSPEWMQRRLRAAGVRPINNLVDITNYVMLECNQPLHAFDLDKIHERQLIIRSAEPGEQLVTLDDAVRKFSRGELLIADPQGGLCVAGVMGGANSEVTDKTKNIFLESAWFNPISIRKTARALNMKTEASLRFEHGIDPNGTVFAANRAAHLIGELHAGKITRGILDLNPRPEKPATIQTSAERINRWLGTDLGASQIQNYLERLNFQVTGSGSGQLTATAPSYRRDIFHMADLAEEVARLYGYDQITATIPESRQLGERTPFQQLQRDCRHLLTGLGLTEVITYSLYAKNTPARLGLSPEDPLARTTELLDPLSEDQAVMRTNLVHSLLETVEFNTKRRQSNLFLYELARVYWPKTDTVLLDEPLHLGAVLTGRPHETGWNQGLDEVDFYDLKGIMERLFQEFHFPAFTMEQAKRPFLHPGQAAEVYVNGRSVGFLGQIHPAVLERYELNQKVFLMELDLSYLAPLAQTEVHFEPLPKFPAVERDLALVVNRTLPASAIEAKIRELGGEMVERVELFDVYQGNQVPDGMRSLAFGLTYRAKDRTLSDNEVNQLQEGLLRKLAEIYQAKVREA